MILNDAVNFYMGSTQVQSVYIGTTKIWPSGVSGSIWTFTQTPSTITNFKVIYSTGNMIVNWGDTTSSSLSSNIPVSHTYS